VAKEPSDVIGEVARYLGHEGSIRVRGDAGDLDGACGEVDDEEDVVSHEAARRPRLDGEEVGGGDRVGVPSQECPPGRRRLWGRRDAWGPQDLGDRVPRIVGPGRDYVLCGP